MTQATIATPAVEKQTCIDCPCFQSHNELRYLETEKGKITNPRYGAGWCKLFDHCAREYHEMTNDCINSSDLEVTHELKDNLNIFPNINLEKLEAFPTEEIIDLPYKPRSEYQVGNIVRIIDEDEDPEEWGVFKVSEVRHNKLLHDNIESYLQGSQWYYHLVSNSDSKSFGKSIWVAQKEICPKGCHFDEGHLFNSHNPQPTDTFTKSAKPKPILKSTSPSTKRENLYTVLRTWDNGSVYLGSRVESVLVKSKRGNAKPSWETVIQSQGIVKGDVLTRGRGGFLVKVARSHAA